MGARMAIKSRSEKVIGGSRRIHSFRGCKQVNHNNSNEDKEGKNPIIIAKDPLKQQEPPLSGTTVIQLNQHRKKKDNKRRSLKF